jgi:hypothetical protein
VWHVKEPSLLKAVSAKLCSPVTGNGDSRKIGEKLLMQLKTKKQTNIPEWKIKWRVFVVI